MDTSIEAVRITRQTQAASPLIVDLDGTLVRTDTLVECLLALSGRPRAMIHGLVSILHGKAHMKQEIAAASDLDPSLLPYNKELLSLLRAELQDGRSLILATGADRKIASAVAGHLSLFDLVLASDGTRNLTGDRKLAAIQQAIGDQPFTYIGNHRSDLAIWRVAQSGIIVSSSRSLQRAAGQLTDVKRSCRTIKSRHDTPWRDASLPVVEEPPGIRAHRDGSMISDLHGWATALLMFIAFSCAASAMYLANDLLDLAADRRHARKRLRPFAAANGLSRFRACRRSAARSATNSPNTLPRRHN